MHSYAAPDTCVQESLTSETVFESSCCKHFLAWQLTRITVNYHLESRHLVESSMLRFIKLKLVHEPVVETHGNKLLV